jgi:hypothetical protein
VEALHDDREAGELLSRAAASRTSGRPPSGRGASFTPTEDEQMVEAVMFWNEPSDVSHREGAPCRHPSPPRATAGSALSCPRMVERHVG